MYSMGVGSKKHYANDFYRRKYHSKTIRKNVTIPEWPNDLAENDKINFSQTLTEALKEKLDV